MKDVRKRKKKEKKRSERKRTIKTAKGIMESLGTNDCVPMVLRKDGSSEHVAYDVK